MGLGERIDRLAGFIDAHDRRERCRIDLEEFRTDRLADQANVRDGDNIAVTVATGVTAGGQMRLKRSQRCGNPMTASLHPLRLVELELVLEIFAHAWHNQRMGIARHDLRQTADSRAASRIFRQ